MSGTVVPNPLERPWLPVPEAGHLLAGLGRSASYEAAARGDLPTLSIGRKRVVPTMAILRLLGLEVPLPQGQDDEGGPKAANASATVPSCSGKDGRGEP